MGTYKILRDFGDFDSVKFRNGFWNRHVFKTANNSDAQSRLLNAKDVIT